MVKFQPVFNVWTRIGDDENTWECQFTTNNLEEAAKVYRKFQADGFGVAVYEKGSFTHKGRRVTGQVVFIWNEPLYEYMLGEPKDRGFGWSDDYDVLVEYDYPGKGALTATSPDRAEVPTAEVLQYASTPCEGCGKILPMDKLQRLDHKVETGSSSGSYRSSYSTSTRYGSKSTSSTIRRGSSSSSGRKHFKNETLYLCAPCYETQVSKDRTQKVLNVIGWFGRRLLS